MADTITIHAVGDVSPARDRGGFLLAPTASVLSKADIGFANLRTHFRKKNLREQAPQVIRSIKIGNHPPGMINCLAAQQMPRRSLTRASKFVLLRVIAAFGWDKRAS